MNYATPSGLKTATAQISSLSGSLSGVDVSPPTSGYATLTVYDSKDSDITGKIVLVEVDVDAGFTSVNHEFFAPVAVNNGIYAVLTQTGTGAKYNIRFTVG